MPLAVTPETEYLRLAFAAASSPMLVVDATSREVIDANPALAQLLGTSVEELVGRPIADFLVEVPPPDVERQIELSRTDGSRAHTMARSFACGNGAQEIWLLVFATTPGAGQPHGAAGAPLDSLTGLPTRVHFDRCLAECLDRVRRLGPPFAAVMFLDLDEFKPVNDRFGHAMGDQVLAAVAQRLASGIRPGDLLARRGGDEFTLLVDGVQHPDEALHIAERLTRLLHEPLQVDGQQLTLGASIGIAMVDGSLADPARIVAAADTAMYASKRLGRPTLYQGATT